MRVWWVFVVAGVGCRFNFDELGDDGIPCVAPVGHDEDGDGVDDACDGCPHIAEAQQRDGDGDRVNDPCDPNPLAARDRIAEFDPFVVARPEWTQGADAPSYANDSLNIDTRNGVLYMSRPFAQVPSGDVIEIAGALGAQSGIETKIGTYMASATTPYYYCELLDLQPPLNFDLAWTYNATNYFTGPITSLQGPLANGPFAVTMAVAPPSVTCQTRWPPGASFTDPIPTGIGPAVMFVFQVYNVDLRLDYFIHIHSD